MDAMTNAKMDPIELEILWSRLISISEEQAAMVLRTAFSQIVRESADYSCVLLTRHGDLLAQPFQTLPALTRSTSAVMKHFLKVWPEWHPGDVAITNDPWLAAGHLHDIAIAVPIFHKDQLVGFCGNIAHQADIGGRGYSADADSIFEEGLALPPMKLYEAGVCKSDILNIIAENVRVPDQVLGDIKSQIVAARVSARRVSELMDDMNINDLDDVAEIVFSKSEAAMRRAISKVPDGEYESIGELDGYEEPLTIKLKMTVKGDELTLDFAGTSPQVHKGINSCYNYTYGYAAYAVKSLLEPHVPNNEGAYRPIRMVAPDGSILNSRRPAPGNSRGRVGHMIVPVVFGAFHKAMPDRVPAEPGSPAPRLNFFGAHDDGRPYQCLLITSGGMGAGPNRDGLSGKAFPTNTKMGSMEVMECDTPLRFLKRQLLPGSGGKGHHIGGLAQEISIEVAHGQRTILSASCERIKHAPAGRNGGGHGVTAGLWNHKGEPLPPKGRTILKTGDIVTVRTPSGGGYGTA